MSKILITGACGAVGFHLSKLLDSMGHELVLVDNYTRSTVDQEYKDLVSQSNVTPIEIDLCDAEACQTLPKDVDYIYHLAAMNGTKNFYERPFSVLKNSTIPAINLLDAYQGTNLKRFLFSSSSETYASTVTLFNWDVPTAEDVPLCVSDPKNVRWSYGASKMHGEIACFAAAKQFGIPVSVIRYHNVYGPRMGDKHVIPNFIEKATQGIYELNGFEDTRSFIYVADAVRATMLVAESPNTIGEIVHIGGAPELTILDLGKKILELMGIQAEIKCFPSPEGSVKRRAPNIDKLKRLTNYQAEYTLENGLKKSIEYYVNYYQKR